MHFNCPKYIFPINNLIFMGHCKKYLSDISYVIHYFKVINYIKKLHFITSFCVTLEVIKC